MSKTLFVIIARWVYEGAKGRSSVYSYAQVESALAKVHHVDDGAIGAFRGRINNLKRLGIVPSSGGRGKKIHYRAYDVLELAFCLQLCEFGIDPSTIKMLSDNIGSEITSATKMTKSYSEDIYIAFSPNILTSQIHRELLRDNKSILYSLSSTSAPENEMTAKRLGEMLAPESYSDGVFKKLSRIATRIAIINFSELLRDISQALGGQFQLD